jgi:hypothetical protein
MSAKVRKSRALAARPVLVLSEPRSSHRCLPELITGLAPSRAVLATLDNEGKSGPYFSGKGVLKIRLFQFITVIFVFYSLIQIK